MDEQRKASSCMTREAVQQTKPTELGFNALYLDTNVLIGFNWPAPALELENLLILAMWSKVTVFLPEPAEWEAEEHWLREIDDCSLRLNNATNDFKRVTRQVSGAATTTHDAKEELLARYRHRMEATKTEFRISLSPFPRRSLYELFELAIRYILPFERGSKNTRGEGKGFQDAVILSSVLEHLKADTGLSGALVTNDEVFAKCKVTEFMPASSGVKFKVLSFDQAYQALYANYQDEHIKKPWNEENDNALKAVESIQNELRAFVKSNLTAETMAQASSKAPFRLQDVENVDVLHVVTPIPDPAKPNRPVRIALSVVARCRVLYEADRFSFLDKIMLAGDYKRIDGHIETTWSWLGGIEATADVKDRQFANISFRSLLSSEQVHEEVKKLLKGASNNETRD